MSSLNVVQLVGRLGCDPESELMPNGATRVTIVISTRRRSFTTRSGKVIPEKTEWHRVIAWGGMAAILERNARKGTEIFVTGEITSRPYEWGGKTHYVTEIQCQRFQFIGPKVECPQEDDDSPAPDEDFIRMGREEP